MADKNKPYVDKLNNSTMGVPHARRKMMAYFQFSMIAVVFVVVFSVIYFISMKKDEKNKIDYSTAELIQYDLPADDTPVAVYETSEGTFKAVLFPEQTPEYYDYFTNLVSEPRHLTAPTTMTPTRPRLPQRSQRISGRSTALSQPTATASRCSIRR